MSGHIHYDRERELLCLLDQRALPLTIREVECASASEAIAAIKNMVVRGAPAIGATAAWACVLAAKDAESGPDWRESLDASLSAISQARPTAVNLAWAVKRMANVAKNASSLAEARKIWLAEAKAIQAEDEAICRKIGANGAALLRDGDTVLTHCNAGALATADYGTALGVIRAAVEQGKKISVIADETRPLLQGARLTAWELARDHIPVTLACDNACALLMSRGMVQLVITGADRIAANGDTANKIGTCGVAIIASYFNIPFYIAAPISSIDFAAKNGADIPIETRDALEVLELDGKRIAPQDVSAFNFAFDITPQNLIRGIITEAGILRPPYAPAIAALSPAL